MEYFSTDRSLFNQYHPSMRRLSNLFITTRICVVKYSISTYVSIQIQTNVKIHFFSYQICTGAGKPIWIATSQTNLFCQMRDSNTQSLSLCHHRQQLPGHNLIGAATGSETKLSTTYRNQLTRLHILNWALALAITHFHIRYALAQGNS